MDFSAMEKCHQSIRTVSGRSNTVSSEHSSKVRSSGFFSFIPAGACLLRLGMLALLLLWNATSVVAANAWNFSNDGILAPPLVVGLDVPSPSPPPLPSDGLLSAPIEVHPSRALISPSSPTGGIPPQISMTYSPSPSTAALAPSPIAKKTKRLSWGIITVIILLLLLAIGIFFSIVLYWCIYNWSIALRNMTFEFRGDLSPGDLSLGDLSLGDLNESVKNFPTQRRRHDRMDSLLKSWTKIFSNRKNIGLKKIGLMTYINKKLQLLFALSGLLNILLSIILDNFFNDLPIRYIAFVILAPLTIFLGFLASGWFPWIPLRFIAFVKQHGFLQNVVPCSPWHNNVVTNFCGEVCLLEPLEQEEGTRLFEFPMAVRNFLYGHQISPHVTIATTTPHSSLDLEIQDIPDVEMRFPKVEVKYTPRPTEKPTSQISLPNLEETPSQDGHIIDIDIEHPFVFHIVDDKRVPILEFNGPSIEGFPLKVQAFKNILNEEHSFDISCTFKNKRTKVYMTIQRLENLIQNMCQWVENPYPIVIDKSSTILHCMTIEDILWEFTNIAYTFKPVHVENCFLAGFGQINPFVTLLYSFATLVIGLIPLVSNKKSYYFLFFLLVLVPYLLASSDSNPLNFYRFKSLFSPICIKICGFNRLYKSKSSFRWCNEFRKKKIVNPSYFWIDEEYANTFPDRASCFDVFGFPKFCSPPKGQSFMISCQGWPKQVPEPPPNTIRKRQHDYKVRVQFDSIKLMKDVNCYTDVKLAFLENDHLLADFNYSAIEVQKLDFIEQLFCCFSDPSFGGYVEKICPMGYFSKTFVAHCPRFIDICNRICNNDPIPKVLLASRNSGSKFIVGVPF